MFWTDGTTYKGNWMFGAQHGKGIHTLPSGETKTGIFENNIFIREEPISDKADTITQLPDVQIKDCVDILEEDKPEQMKFTD